MSDRYPKARRLLKRREFLAVQRAGGGVRTRHFVTLVLFRGDDDPCRLGIVASKRVGNAVARNRGKRRVREWFRHHDALPTGADVVVILRKGSPDLPYAQLCDELDEATVRVVRKALKSLQRGGRAAGTKTTRRAAARGNGTQRG